MSVNLYKTIADTDIAIVAEFERVNPIRHDVIDTCGAHWFGNRLWLSIPFGMWGYWEPFKSMEELEKWAESKGFERIA